MIYSEFSKGLSKSDSCIKCNLLLFVIVLANRIDRSR